jgi:2-iminobutanoate/2-iminopropanoate deaminase
MARQIVFTSKAAKPPATYSQAVKAAGLVFVSGTAPHDPATGAIKGATIQQQTRQCLLNIAAILEEAGSSLDKIVSATVVLAEEDDFPGMVKVVSHKPAGTAGRQASREDPRTQSVHRRNCRGVKRTSSALTPRIKLKALLQRNAQRHRHFKRSLEGRRILVLFNRYDGLARHPDLVGQFLLRHLTPRPQLPNLITDGRHQSAFR